MTQVANCILVITLSYYRMTTIYSNETLKKFQTYLISLLTGDLSFKCVFAHGKVSLWVLSFLIMNHPSPFTYFPPFRNFAIIPPRKLTIWHSTCETWWFKNQFVRRKWLYLYNWVQFSVLQCSYRKYCTSCNVYWKIRCSTVFPQFEKCWY